MSSESIPAPQPKSLESLKIKFKDILDAILYKQLTVENIEIFANEALSETVAFTDDILKEYKNNQNFHANPNLNIHEQEDEAFAILDLPNIQNILQSIIEVKDKIVTLKEYLETNTEVSDKIITPPQENNTAILPGKNNFKEKKVFPRLLTLMYILEHDFEIQKEAVKIIEGKVTPEMMRQMPYVRVEIPELERVVYICEEEGNVSYVFDTAQIAEKNLTLDEIDIDDKGDKNSLIEKYPGIGIRIMQSKNWRDWINTVLGEEITKTQPKILEEYQKEKKSEFIEKKEWLPFEDFQKEVRSLWSGQKNVQKWYNIEQKKYSNWPSAPRNTYKNKGWEDWSQLVEKENPQKEDFLLFEDFKKEVLDLYNGQRSIQQWYDGEERKKHPDWPSAPYETYKNKGWESWPELVGKDNRLKKEFLPFDDFQKEVRSLWSGQKNIVKWYDENKKKHANWPSSPYKFYGEDGWRSWSELVEKKKHS